MLDVRPAGVDDVDVLAPLFTAYRKHFYPHADGDDSRPFLRDRLARRECVTFLAFADGSCAGFIQLYPLWSS